MASRTLYDRAEKVALRSDRRGDGPADRGRVPSFTRILVRPEAGAVLLVGRDRYMVPEDPKRFLRVWVKPAGFQAANGRSQTAISSIPWIDSSMG